MAGFVRLLIGIGLLPGCWATTRALVDTILLAADSNGGVSVDAMALIGGVALFALCWMALPHPVRTYVFGHELTHALWGIFFGARPSNVRVTASGGSVRLSKTNLLITLAPYFFPFYTFLVIVAATVTYSVLRPLPFLPFWMFLIGFTWSFHALFTIETLAQRQPDVTLYGRIFSWTFIFLVNLAFILVWLVAMTSVTFVDLKSILVFRFSSVYVTLGAVVCELVRCAVQLLS